MNLNIYNKKFPNKNRFFLNDEFYNGIYFLFSFSCLTIFRYALETLKILRILNVFIRLKLIYFF